MEYQTATSEVLGVISRSPNELQPVLDTIVETAARLCNADYSQIMRARDDGTWYAAALFGHSTEYAEYLKHLNVEPGRGSITGRALLTGKPIQIADVMSDPDYELHEAQRIAGYRTHLGVPLSRKGQTVGMIILSRKKVTPFSAKEIELVETFADQAVIAIENTRLFEEVQVRTRELTQSLEYQTATSEVLDIISRSKFELQPVFDAIVESGLKLFSGAAVAILLPDGDKVKGAAVAASDPARAEAIKRRLPFPPRTGDYMHALAILDRRVVDIPDAASPPCVLELQGDDDIDAKRSRPSSGKTRFVPRD